LSQQRRDDREFKAAILRAYTHFDEQWNVSDSDSVGTCRSFVRLGFRPWRRPQGRAPREDERSAGQFPVRRLYKSAEVN
jgi:hypothetical protein